MNPVYQSVSELFENKTCYFIPKYQRAYVWGEEQVNDFVDDLSTAFDRRKNGRPKKHFFGGIVTVNALYPGTHTIRRYEVIDGQQRLSTFCLLGNIILKKYRELHTKAKEEENNEICEKCSVQIENLERSYLQFTQLIHGKVDTVKVLTTSGRDDQYYSELIRGEYPEKKNQSHNNILYSFEKICASVSDSLNDSASHDEYFEKLEQFEQILSMDFMILHLVTEDRSEAYQLFQVINDRGMPLTDADLLRCKVLELSEAYPDYQSNVENIWDKIVTHEKTEEQLIWVYESKFGKKPRFGALFDDYISTYYEFNDTDNFSENDIRNLLTKTETLGDDIELVRELLECNWPYENQNPVTAWDRDRLTVLIDYLGNTAAVPLLLSAKKSLDHQKFSAIVQMLERFFFRYKIMCNGHNTALKKIYSGHALKITDETDCYDIETLRSGLNELIEEKAPETTFLAAIDELVYHPRRNKKNIKYFLLMIDQYLPWYNSEDISRPAPTCFDKSRVQDRLAGTTIEHIYPKALDQTSDIFCESLEEVKNKIQNLTILPSHDNQLVGTNAFDDKKAIFSKSSSFLTRHIATYPTWNARQVKNHHELLKKAAVAIFVA